MDARLNELRGEMAKLQLEVSMLRQMMGSLHRAEQSNVDRLRGQTSPQTFGPVGQLMPNEQSAVQQLEQMKQIGNQLKQHVDHLSSMLQTNRPSPNSTVMSDPYSQGLRDPMQRLY
ncbi:hypothetical protein [Effusibacillus lacus]|uniref:Uncharacterized protein n=1 Tax=Effusibacillus lacus TaxID=1348429 RepID=A0A292YHV1_9BACL|nr:hypothetical protein [Effusibacillus lacus]TCS70805.1 hypothetical protein EDD64_13036 [Effusibacillus lacus]GAX89398.1 hypothetical protein EFBL_1016 [Effusibacillus lacus]